MTQQTDSPADLRSRVKAHPVFSLLSEGDMGGLLAAGDPEAFAEGDVLLLQGDISDSAIFILEGPVEIMAQTASGPVRLSDMKGPALLGEIGVLAGFARTATVRATGPGQLLRIEKALFNRLADNNPEILRYVIRQLGGQVRAFNSVVGVYTSALTALEREEYDEEMLDNLNNPSAELANFAASFRKMARQIVVRRQRRDEMESAAAIQRAMLPSPLPRDHQGRVDLFAAMRPAREVGGDFYDAFFVDHDRLVVTIGDVSGKGVPAALFMAVCQTTMRMALRADPENFGRAIEHTNALLEAENATSAFATFFGAIVDLGSGRLTYWNCGHNPPMLRRSDGTIEELASRGVALGILVPAEYETAETTMQPGDCLLLYTDGLTEAHDQAGNLFEEDRLKSVIAKRHTGDIRVFAEGIFAEVDSFAAGAPRHDDLTCVALAYIGPKDSANRGVD